MTKSTKELQPFEHIDRACELADLAERDVAADPTTEERIALARLHVEIAQAKMVGRLRR
jgi:hypothetical protein